MDLMSEYLKNNWTVEQIQEELIRLVNEYNKLKDTYMLIYTGIIGKSIPDAPLTMDDYFQIYGMLKDVGSKKLDVYIETPGGSGEAAEEIVKFLRKKFDTVEFIVSGEAKSAGTLLVLSADEIWMTNSGSLGPIDAQVLIGRTIVSAFDYMEWINEKYIEAEKNKKLNPFDATLIAQISPGELKYVNNALKYAEDLVVKWLQQYKFKNWSSTETTKTPVTQVMKEKTAKKVVADFINHGKWRTHGRSIKIEDLEGEIGLKINKIDEDPKMADLIYRIQTCTRLIFSNSYIYKLFVTKEGQAYKNAFPEKFPLINPVDNLKKKPDAAELEIKCDNCEKIHQYYKSLNGQKKIPELEKKGYLPLPNEDKITCKCGHEINLKIVHEMIDKKLKKFE
jgi:ClpP class serine protease